MMTLPNFKIASFQIVDTSELIAVIDSVCADTPWMQTRLFEPTPAWQYVLENEDCFHHLLLLPKVEEKIVGWCRLFPVDTQHPWRKELGIGVLKPYRQQGVGMTMLRYAIKVSRRASVTEIILTTHRENRPAIRLFEKFGFVVKARESYHWRMNLKISNE